MIQTIAKTPPMGWNSWDCYGASVTEDEVRGNAEYMANYMKSYGWEYIVIDIQWYEPGAFTSHYRPFVPLEMDEYSRLMPAVNRFPSAADGQGFRPLAEYIRSLGLKFGIHIMRGIPRQAVHADTAILGTDVRARAIAQPFSICSWNTDMYGVNCLSEGAQEYYNSLFLLYAEWGVDLVKVDDIANTFFSTDAYSAAGEIELIRNAINYCGRKMVLSLSPGPAPLEQAEHLKNHANMWRISGDYWDCWDDLLSQFEQCRNWSIHSGLGHWPDADILPLGRIAIRSCEKGHGDRLTRFTKDEQMTMMTLWCMFRSPLMVGGELRDNDEWTLSLLTNPEVLRILNHSHSGKQLFNRNQKIAWTAQDEDGSTYLALFNTTVSDFCFCIQLSQMELKGKYNLRDLLSRQDYESADQSVCAVVPAHGVRLFKLLSQ